MRNFEISGDDKLSRSINDNSWLFKLVNASIQTMWPLILFIILILIGLALSYDDFIATPSVLAKIRRFRVKPVTPDEMDPRHLANARRQKAKEVLRWEDIEVD
ncbi:unnamed protein product [Rodentolepis nana]|uniref:HCO3_cotransp domain-containing protein n=1 Tax=Rodentolepis nana TaxID=102285 RepID=A0A0R3T7L7_RODNA|nr:unnamed protein product [Rodentolepis nana]